jgi:hypothetical protein
MKCHHKLTLRQPELATLVAVSGFNQVVVGNIIDENKIIDSRIFNLNETSHTVLQLPEKIITQKTADINLAPFRRANEVKVKGKVVHMLSYLCITPWRRMGGVDI